MFEGKKMSRKGNDKIIFFEISESGGAENRLMEGVM